MHGGGGMMLVNGQGYGSTKKYGTDTKSKNHYMDNVRRMRQIQRQSKEREAESKKPVKALWKSDKYRDVQSRVKGDIEREPDAPRPHSACFTRAHSRSGPSVKFPSRPSTPEVVVPDEKLTVPRASSATDIKMTRNNFDFIKINGVNAKRAPVVRSPSLTALDDLKKSRDEEFTQRHKFGEVPKYLQSRKVQWKKNEEDRIANIPDPEMPPGHRALPEAERRTTLSLLIKKEEELVREMSALPLRMDTFRIRSQKQEIEKKLAEVDEAKKIFSRSKVFVKVD
ncbi:enkurin domain-containing protein 1-like [Pecten maximus]|uniref:enkurin domain-containing protein 1-like n=1 Tax=Pecten maximus TaxID=6579 RepID=UPI0014587D8D|nr:enkurin domain-containing protein 1-like [Pecten maximus]